MHSHPDQKKSVEHMAEKQKENEKNLVIVESPAKAKTIEKFLGKNFVVKSSFGHIRDLAKKDLGVDVDKNFEPQYIVSPDKKERSEERRVGKECRSGWSREE